MANKFQIKRTTVSGRTPNTTNSGNTAYIDAGELAINLTDKKLISSDGTYAFEVGSNLQSLSVTSNASLANTTLTGTLVANGSAGTNNALLTSNATGVYWSPLTGGVRVYDESGALLTILTAGISANFIDSLNDVDTTTVAPVANQALIWDGTNWVPGNVASSGGGASVTISDTPPGSPTANSLWWDSSVGVLRIYYNDGDTSQWVDATPQGGYLTGVNNAVQFNDSGGPGASNNFTFDKTSNTLRIGANVSVNTSTIFVGNSSVNTTIVAGNIALFGTSIYVGSNVVVNSSSIQIGNSSVNTVIGPQSITVSGTALATSTNVDTAYSNAVATAATDASSKAATAYSNATSYADTKAATAYSNATSYADTKAATAYSNATSYADTKAATAYSNAVSTAATDASSKAATAYSNAVSTAATDASAKAATAYTNATSYADTKAATAYTNATSYADTKAATAYSNATTFASNASNISSGTLAAGRLPQANTTSNGAVIFLDSVSNTATSIYAPTMNAVKTAYDYAGTIAATAYTNAASYADTKAATVFSNATSYADTKAATAYSNAVSTAATDASSKAATAYTNATSYADTVAATAYTNATSTASTDASTKAATAYSNAVAYAASNTYVNSTFLKLSGGTMTGALTVSNTVSVGNTTITGVANVTANLAANNLTVRGNLQIDGNLTVSGTTVTINATSLSVGDNMIYLNANSATANPDLGFAGNYNDGTYRHAGFFRDATDGVFKVFDQYVPEPDASAYIDTSNNTFRIADFQSNNTTLGTANVVGALAARSTLSVNGAVTVSNTAALGNTTITGFANVTSTIQGGSSLTIAGALSGVTTAAMGNTTITGFANVTSTIQGGSSLTIAGALSGVTTAAMGNTTITGTANVSQGLTANTLTVSTNTATFGTAVYHVANGYVGVGTSAPAGKLHIKDTGANIIKVEETSATGYTGISLSGTGTQTFQMGMGGPSETLFGVANKWFIYDGLAGAMRIVMNASGQVGIGNTSPTNKLRVEGDASILTTLAAGNTTITGFANVTSTIQGGSSLTIAGALSGVTTAAMGNTTITGFANVTTTIQGGSSLTIAGALSGVTTAAMGNTTITGTANVSQGLTANTLTVSTNTATFGTAVYHVANGFVGVGVSSPRVALDLGAVNNRAQVLLLGETAANNRVGFGLDSASAGMRLFTVNNSSQMIDLGGISTTDGSTWTRNHRFGIAGGSSWVQEQGGSFGVGTTSPSYVLHVVDPQSWTTGFSNHATFTMPNMTGGGLSLGFGKAGSTYNLGKLVFNYTGSGSTSNYVGIGFWDNDNILNVTAGSRVGIGTTSPGAKFDVRGSSAGISIYSSASANTDFALALTTGAGYCMYLTTVGTTDETLRFVNSSGSELMRLTSGGNLGIGATPAGANKLQISGATQGLGISVNSTYSGPSILSTSTSVLYINPNGNLTTVGQNGANFPSTLSVRQASSSTAAFSVEDYSGPNSWFYVNSTGSVGIGTSSPRSKLDISQANPQLTLRNINDVGGAFIQDTYSAMQLGMYNPSGSTWGAISANQQRTVFALNYNGKVGSTTNAITDGSGQDVTWRNVLDDGSGNFGVGTSTPSSFGVAAVSTTGTPTLAYLSVLNGGVSYGAAMESTLYIGGARTDSIDNGKIAGYRLKTYSADNNGAYFAIEAASRATGSTSPPNVFTERMRIDTSGNVGIGTTSIGARLDLYSASDLGTGANGIRVQRPGSYGQYGYLEYLVSSDQTVLGSLYTGGGSSQYGQIWFRQHSSSASRDAMIINSSGNVGIGTTSPAGKLHVAGDIYSTGNIYSSYSDERLKTILGPLDNALDGICSVDTFYFEANEKALELGADPGRQVGVSAQSVQKFAPELVNKSALSPDYLTVQYERLIPFLVEAVKTLKQTNDELTQRVAALEQMVLKKE